MNTATKQALRIFIILLIISATLAAYWQLKVNGFVNFDDDIYITGNAYVQKGLTCESISYAFSLFNNNSIYWHPLTWLSLMMDYEFFGLNPVGYHLVNLLLHMANAILLFLIFNRMTAKIWASALVAALFALHPLNVESVAWAVERKTVLSSLFWMLSILAYLRYVQKRDISRYAVLFLCMALGLMTKSMLVSLPFALLLLDYWPLGRLHKGKAIGTATSEKVTLPETVRLPVTHILLEKIPLLLLSILSVVVSMISLIEPIENIDTIPYVPFSNKLANALVSYVAYIIKMVWPAELAVFYPLRSSYPFWQVAGAVVVLSVITAAAIRYAVKRPWFLMGWFWYLGILLPVIGFVRGGVWPAMADRFTYLPLIGLFVIVAWSMEEISVRWPRCRQLVCCGVFMMLSALIICSNIQTRYWKDSVSLFEHTEKVTRNNLLAHANLGSAYYRKGDIVNAFECFKKELNLDPTSINIELLHGNQYFENGNLAAAANEFKQALMKREGNLQAFIMLGRISEKTGDYEQAVSYYNNALFSPVPDGEGYKERAKNELRSIQKLFNQQLDPMKQMVTSHPLDLKARGELALKLDKLGMYDEALSHYLIMETLNKDSWQLYYNIATVYKKLKKFPDAARYYEKSLTLNQSNPDALNNMGIAFKQMKDYKQAITAFEKAMSADNRFEPAPFNLAITYLQTGDKSNAVRYLKYTLDNFPHLTSKVMKYQKYLPEKLK